MWHHVASCIIMCHHVRSCIIMCHHLSSCRMDMSDGHVTRGHITRTRHMDMPHGHVTRTRHMDTPHGHVTRTNYTHKSYGHSMRRSILDGHQRSSVHLLCGHQNGTWDRISLPSILERQCVQETISVCQDRSQLACWIASDAISSFSETILPG